MITFTTNYIVLIFNYYAICRYESESYIFSIFNDLLFATVCYMYNYHFARSDILLVLVLINILACEQQQFEYIYIYIYIIMLYLQKIIIKYILVAKYRRV